MSLFNEPEEEPENSEGLESPDMPNRNDPDNTNVMPMYTGENRSDTVRLLLDSTPVLKRLKAIFLNKEIKITRKGEEIWEDKTTGKPLMNHEGADVFITELNNFVNENTVGGIYNDEEIRIKTIWAGLLAIELIAEGYKSYGIDKKKWSLIVQTVEANVNAVLKKAKNGATLETIGDINKIHQVTTNTMHQTPPPKTKFLDRFRINPQGMV